MGEKEGNNGFIGLHTPMGMMLLMFSFFLIFAFILAGAAFFKFGYQRDKELRAKLREGIDVTPDKSA